MKSKTLLLSLIATSLVFAAVVLAHEKVKLTGYVVDVMCAADHTKARYAFVCGDFRRVHRTALIACVYRASEWRHKAVELAAHDLLQYLDSKTMKEAS